MSDNPGAHFLSILELATRLQKGERLLGLDLGEKTIGLAISDVTRAIASPLETIKRSKLSIDCAKLKTVAEARGAGGLILGLPLNMDGTSGPRAQSTRAFARNLLAHWPVPLALWDERLSTAAVTRTLLEADASRARRAQIVDKMAAAYILQGALDAMRSAPH